jgi:hypothetical protein
MLAAEEPNHGVALRALNIGASAAVDARGEGGCVAEAHGPQLEREHYLARGETLALCGGDVGVGALRELPALDLEAPTGTSGQEVAHVIQSNDPIGDFGGLKKLRIIVSR